jgi:hypothetical protein
MKSEALYDIMDCAIRKALELLQTSESRTALVDLYLQPNPDAGEFSILDDEDHPLVKVPISDWQEKYDTLNVEEELLKSEAILKQIVSVISEEGLFESIHTLKPFSVLMVDDEMDEIAELLLIDDEQMVLDDVFLNNLDQELNDFYEKLMSDI